MNKQEIFIRKQEAIIEKGVLRILSEQKKGLVEILMREQKSYEIKSIEDYVREYLENIKIQIPDYLFLSLQNVMQKSYKLAMKPFSSILADYERGLVFNIETSSAVRYLRSIQNLHLSQRDGSINKTTQKEILTILAEGVKSGKSYTQIGEEIRNTNPFVFSESRAKLIAIQETGQAYGWSSYEPGRRLVQKGYKLIKKWSTVKDGLVRETHRLNELAGDVPFEQPFPGTGDMFGPSKEFRCRCRSTYRIVG